MELYVPRSMLPKPEDELLPELKLENKADILLEL
jgi:hypothetical protein